MYENHKTHKTQKSLFKKQTLKITFTLISPVFTTILSTLKLPLMSIGIGMCHMGEITIINTHYNPMYVSHT